MNTEHTDATENTEVTTTEPEVKNPAALLAKNRELLGKLAAAQAELATAQTALAAAQEDATTQRLRWHQSAVLAPLEEEIKGVTAGPWKYGRDVFTELGLLKMEPDAHGDLYPAWFDNKGNPANLEKGLYPFLCAMIDAMPGSDLATTIRSSGTSGGGAHGGAGTVKPAAQAVAPAPAPPAFGLR